LNVGVSECCQLYAPYGTRGKRIDQRLGGFWELCLFADGHTEALDVANMTAADRRKYFLRDEN